VAKFDDESEFKISHMIWLGLELFRFVQLWSKSKTGLWLQNHSLSLSLIIMDPTYSLFLRVHLFFLVCCTRLKLVKKCFAVWMFLMYVLISRMSVSPHYIVCGNSSVYQSTSLLAMSIYLQIDTYVDFVMCKYILHVYCLLTLQSSIVSQF